MAGSGKTYTMTGPAREGGGGERVADLDDTKGRGVIPRAVEMIFQEVNGLREGGWSYEMSVSFLEIYNEALRDLLASPGQEHRKLEIKHVDHGRQAQVTNLQIMQVEQEADVIELLRRATEARATAATQHNEGSSRSHSVFTMNIKGIHPVTQEVVYGVLNLIDLAGSERLAKAGNRTNDKGERLRETQSINKSLSSLCDVISALANREGHVPFRNSKLTYLLQPCLGGDCKCLMFVNISPVKAHLPESINSLRFAHKVSSVELRRRQMEPV
uniref:Kinesin-like protein n=1 Tax=Guillardia theta (strain CCMP2712) TaxID=905079 RepID=A0A0C3UEJ4_GUITC